MDPYSEREPQDVQILWGRVVVLGGALLLALLLGMWLSGGDEGVDQEVHAELKRENERLAEQNKELQQQIDELSQGQPPENPPTADDDEDGSDDGDSTSNTDSDSDGDGGDGQSQVYVVQRGDTLSGIAQRFYGSSGEEARERIADANGIEPDATLTVGQELTIPPADD